MQWDEAGNLGKAARALPLGQPTIVMEQIRGVFRCSRAALRG
jgi:hypothetical protein